MKYNIANKINPPKTAKVRSTRQIKANPNAVSKSQYPFNDLQVNSSFFEKNKTADQMRHAMYRASKQLGHGYYSEDRVERGVSGVRIWRMV